MCNIPAWRKKSEWPLTMLLQAVRATISFQPVEFETHLSCNIANSEGRSSLLLGQGLQLGC